MRFGIWAGTIAIVVLVYQFAAFALSSAYPSCPSGERIRVPLPVGSHTGHSFVASLPEFEREADNVGSPDTSPLVVCENDRLLGPAHALHADIAALGRGRFSHWGTDVLFSSSDNSNPNRNGRSYLFIRPSRQ